MNVPVKVGDHMVIFMGYGSGRTDESAAETGYAVLHDRDLSLLRLLVESEAVGGADIEAESAASAGLFLDFHLQHSLIPPHSADNLTFFSYLHIKLHPANGVS